MDYDVIVIGGGPSGLENAIAAYDNGKHVCLIEREARLGGILKQCIHDGFGLITFNEKLTGPDYATRFAKQVKERNIDVLLLTFVTDIIKTEEGFKITIVNTEGVKEITSKTLILSTGCRERSPRQVNIMGTRPSGLLTAGTAQNYINILGKKVGKKVVILGSGDIGLIMARRLSLEGAEVIGVYEIKDTPSGLSRNINQCLKDFDIPLHLSHTVTKVFGESRLTGVEISKVDSKMNVIPGTNQFIECDSLIVSVGLIPENELLEKLGAKKDFRTKGAKVDQTLMTSIDGLFVSGNCLHVFDLVDYVTESAKIAGTSASNYEKKDRQLVDINIKDNLLYVVPQCIDINKDTTTKFYFRSNRELKNATLKISVDGNEVLKKRYIKMLPPEMETLLYKFENLNKDSHIEITVEA